MKRSFAVLTLVLLAAGCRDAEQPQTPTGPDVPSEPSLSGGAESEIALPCPDLPFVKSATVPPRTEGDDNGNGLVCHWNRGSDELPLVEVYDDTPVQD